jgi:hypothetical protein
MAKEALVVCMEGEQKRLANGCVETSVDEACQQVQAAIVDRRENGGTVASVRTAALKLIRTMFDDLDTVR